MRPAHHSNYSLLKGDESSSNNVDFQNFMDEKEGNYTEMQKRPFVDVEKFPLNAINSIDDVENPCIEAQKNRMYDRFDDDLQKLFQKYDFKDDIISKLHTLGVCTILQFEEFCDDNDKLFSLKQIAKPIHFEKFTTTLGLEKPHIDGQSLDIISEYIPKESKVDVVEETPYHLMSKVFSCTPYLNLDSGGHRIISAVNEIIKFINSENDCNKKSRSYKYDCFISYRVKTESTLAFNIYIELTRPERKIFDKSIGKERNITAFLDREELPNGKKWKKRVFACIKK